MTRPDELTVALWLSAVAVVVGLATAVLSCRAWKWSDR
jgi:hypothetical protein